MSQPRLRQPIAPLYYGGPGYLPSPYGHQFYHYPEHHYTALYHHYPHYYHHYHFIPMHYYG
ncbi:hypothetical protein E5161_17115 [Cohnella pontilimi]|uniref:Uncharacterized protein n=1 Tax=Cohnella pontilimi TaxID=2564100 RepID=A0A4U0F513_9BACL|nr:hypothetical protein [Cohnella pontilimi]TJY39681.1 hypothetical protein E5161_17115 [Cohnella pontilimi]